MVNPKNSPANLTNLPKKQVLAPPSLERTMTDFMQSLGDVLLDITALEVNTMVVERISGDKFIPWKTYRDIYPISYRYLSELGINETLRDRYIDLRRSLELEYTLLLTNPNSDFYDPSVLADVKDDFQILTDPNVEMHEIKTRLPDPVSPTNPQQILQVQKLLDDGGFLRSLRKMGELKAALDNRNASLQKQEDELPSTVKQEAIANLVKTDIIYAQTVIQLDGDVINRYSKEIFDHPHKDLILQIHSEGVSTGERQWRGLLEFIINLVQNSLQLNSSRGLFFPNSSRKNGQD